MTSFAQAAPHGTLDMARVFGGAGELIKRRGLMMAAVITPSFAVLQSGSSWMVTKLDEAVVAAAPGRLSASLATIAVNEVQAFFMAGVEAVMAAWIVGLMTAGATSSAAGAGRAVLSRALAIFAYAMLFHLCVVGGFFLLIVPGLLLALAWAVSLQALVTEGLSPLTALRRSAVLTKGHRGLIFGLGLILGVAMVVMNLSLAEVGDGGGPLIAAARSPLSRYLLLPVAGGLEQVVIGAVFASLYVELVAAKDGGLRSMMADVFN